MDIAQAKRKENIAEYILYLWQLEDLLRALQLSPEAIYSQLVAPRDVPQQRKDEILAWYLDLASLLRKEGKEQSGHLDHTLHLIGDLHNLHLHLMRAPVGEHYRHTFARLAPELPKLRAMLHDDNISDTEICFRALYAAMLYRIRGDGKGAAAIADTVELISPCLLYTSDAADGHLRQGRTRRTGPFQGYVMPQGPGSERGRERAREGAR